MALVRQSHYCDRFATLDWRRVWEKWPIFLSPKSGPKWGKLRPSRSIFRRFSRRKTVDWGVVSCFYTAKPICKSALHSEIFSLFWWFLEPSGVHFSAIFGKFLSKIVKMSHFWLDPNQKLRRNGQFLGKFKNWAGMAILREGHLDSLLEPKPFACGPE